jgi:hypothetical protein
MSAPSPWSGPLPALFTGSYLKRQHGLGNLYVGAYTAAGGNGTVFDNLVNPPATGVEAETDSLERAQTVGTTAMTSPNNGKTFWTPAMVVAMVAKQFDFMRTFYTEASISRNSSGVPIA